MKLFFAPFACSLSPHIALREAGVPFELVRVDLTTKRTERGDDYLRVNPKGYVPALEIAEGKVLTEGPAIVQFIADQKPEKQLAPAQGSFERYRLQESLNFISTEVHKQFAPLFSASSTEDRKADAVAALTKRFGTLNEQLGTGPYMLGEHFTVADGYLFVMLLWADKMKLKMDSFKNLRGLTARVNERPAVRSAIAAETAAQASAHK